MNDAYTQVNQVFENIRMAAIREKETAAERYCELVIAASEREVNRPEDIAAIVQAMQVLSLKPAELFEDFQRIAQGLGPLPWRHNEDKGMYSA